MEEYSELWHSFFNFISKPNLSLMFHDLLLLNKKY